MQGEAERALRCRPPSLPNRPHFDASRMQDVQLRAKSNRISEQDDGSGVSAPPNLPKLFARFWKSADRRYIGGGPGLSICRDVRVTSLSLGWRKSR